MKKSFKMKVLFARDVAITKPILAGTSRLSVSYLGSLTQRSQVATVHAAPVRGHRQRRARTPLLGWQQVSVLIASREHWRVGRPDAALNVDQENEESSIRQPFSLLSLPLCLPQRWTQLHQGGKAGVGQIWAGVTRNGGRVLCPLKPFFTRSVVESRRSSSDWLLYTNRD